MINVIKGKDPIWDTMLYDAVLVGTNIYNYLVNGFQRKMWFRYTAIGKANDNTKYSDTSKLGKLLDITKYKNPQIMLAYICGYPMENKVTVDYVAIEKCLIKADERFTGKSVMTTMLGCSQFDGNGDKERVMQIMERTVNKMDLTVYDYEQFGWREETDTYLKQWKELESSDPEKYEKIWGNRDMLLRKMYLKRL